jgi:pimeloyl-ACP methyl ester carboxylesterase
VTDAVGATVRSPQPFFREAGAGQGVVCLHANASTSGQWRGLMERLAPGFRVFAPDSYGAGKSPSWPSDRAICLRDEAALIEPVLAKAGAPYALVGHSYGAAVALISALMKPGRVRALALYEPSLFSLIDADRPAPNDADGIRQRVVTAAAAVDAGDLDAAAECFIDYWMWPGAWAQTPPERKRAIAAWMVDVRKSGHALFNEPTPLAAFRALDIPLLYMIGKRTTASARGVARLLVPALPRAEVVEFSELGHMGPVTHPHVVNEKIAEFLEKL